MACGVRGAPLWSVVACGCGVRRRVAAAKASARQGQRGHEPGRLLSLAATLMLLARRSTEDPPERLEAVQTPPRRAAGAGIAGGQHRQRAAAVGGRRGHESGRLLSLAATLMLLARRSTEDPPERREAVQRPRPACWRGRPSHKPAHGSSLLHLVFIVVRRNNCWSMGSKVGKKHGESTSHARYFLLPL